MLRNDVFACHDVLSSSPASGFTHCALDRARAIPASFPMLLKCLDNETHVPLDLPKQREVVDKVSDEGQTKIVGVVGKGPFESDDDRDA
jgi:hypothetical protein